MTTIEDVKLCYCHYIDNQNESNCQLISFKRNGKCDKHQDIDYEIYKIKNEIFITNKIKTLILDIRSACDTIDKAQKTSYLLNYIIDNIWILLSYPKVKNCIVEKLLILHNSKNKNLNIDYYLRYVQPEIYDKTYKGLEYYINKLLQKEPINENIIMDDIAYINGDDIDEINL